MRATQQTDWQLPCSCPRSFRLLVSLIFCACALGAWAQSPRVVLTPAPGFSIAWDGNNGGFSSPDAGAGPSNNVALASNGATAIGSSQLDLGVHFIANANDGLYGNAHCWISANGLGGSSDPDPWLGIAFTNTVAVSSIAWGRDNGDTTETGCAGGTCVDRTLGTYTLQYTTVAAPDATTAETGDAATGWATIGTVQYLAGTEDASFTSYLRHRFDVAQGASAIAATGLRIKVSDGLRAIDEIEVNPIADPIPPITTFIEITPAAGYAISWDRNEGNFSTTNTPAPAPVNEASTARGATAFGSSQLDLGVHFISNVNDGRYGNAHSWIPDFLANPDPAPFIGINFGRRILLRSIAWGRDNGDVAGDCCGGTLTDRALGVYVVQVTTVTNPGVATPEACGPTPEAGWTTIGTINYRADDLKYFNSYLRHRFDVTQGGAPIPATGLRIRVPANTSAIDEIEVNSNLAIEQNQVRVTNAPGLSIVWDGNNGDFDNPAVGAAPPDNRALTNYGTVAFGSSQLDLGVHFIRNVNDGLYGNAHSWIPDFLAVPDPAPFIGLNFNGTVAITNIAWSRDNGDTVEGPCAGGTCTDRALGAYILQYTTAAAPDVTTPETGDAATGWADIGTIHYVAAAASYFTPYLRHRFELAEGPGPINATGVRIKVPDNQSDIDEVEINTAVEPPPLPPAVGLTGAPGYTIAWDGNDGHFQNPVALASAPDNAALPSNGTMAFGSSQLDFGVHFITNVIDGLYGNGHSWIPDFVANPDPNPFVGLNFGRTVMIENIAWGRDNGDTTEAACGGTCTDRVLGVYTLQVTAVPSPGADTQETDDPATGWATLGTAEYRRADPPDFNPHLRHRFDVSAGGSPIEATGLRIKVPNNESDIDELEVNTVTRPPQPVLNLVRTGGNVVISWSYGGGLEGADQVTGPWTCLQDARSPHTVAVGSGPMRYYRVRR